MPSISKAVFLLLCVWKVQLKDLFLLKEGNVLFNNTINTFYLLLYCVRHVIKDHSDSEIEETCCHHYMGYTF